jgi:FMN reductase [NAD(P)H]
MTDTLTNDGTTDGQALLKARFGMELPGVEVPDAIAPLLDRRVVRRYTEQPVPDSLLDALLAAAQSAPAKSDLQQYSVVVMRDAAHIKQIADWIGTMDWIATAPVFLVWCGDMRRGQRLCELHKMPHANNNLDTFLNTAVDCSLAMAQFMTAAEAVGLGTCPISYVRSHIERVSPLLGLPSGVYPVAGLTVGWPVFRRPTSMRLPPAIVVHRERYDDSALEADAAAYDTRRREREPKAPGSLKNTDIYPPREGVGWSEDVARQLSVPERFGLAAYLRTKGFDLA